MDVGIDQAGEECLTLAGYDFRVRRHRDIFSQGRDFSVFDDHCHPGQDLFAVKDPRILDDGRLPDFRRSERTAVWGGRKRREQEERKRKYRRPHFSKWQKNKVLRYIRSGKSEPASGGKAITR